MNFKTDFKNVQNFKENSPPELTEYDVFMLPFYLFTYASFLKD